MTSPADPKPGTKPASKAASSPRPPAPEWAEALRDLYQGVVEEPLPPALADLIARLDEED